jgi:hypothetical protein
LKFAWKCKKGKKLSAARQRLAVALQRPQQQNEKSEEKQQLQQQQQQLQNDEEMTKTRNMIKEEDDDAFNTYTLVKLFFRFCFLCVF